MAHHSFNACARNQLCTTRLTFRHDAAPFWQNFGPRGHDPSVTQSPPSVLGDWLPRLSFKTFRRRVPAGHPAEQSGAAVCILLVPSVACESKPNSLVTCFFRFLRRSSSTICVMSLLQVKVQSNTVFVFLLPLSVK